MLTEELLQKILVQKEVETGKRGGEYVAPSGTSTGAIIASIRSADGTDVVISGMTSSNITGISFPLTIPAGTILVGRFAGVALTAGSGAALMLHGEK